MGNNQKKQSPQYNQNQQQQQKPCTGCGSLYHRSNERERKCPGWGKKCENCGIDNHLTSVCFRQSDKQPSVGQINLIAHVKYDSKRDTCTTISTDKELIKATLTPKVHNKHDSLSYDLDVFPDSGAAICVGGTSHLYQINLSESDLSQCNKSIEAVGGGKLYCEGWLPVEFSVEGHTTTKPLYICEKVDRIYLSKSACIDVTILPPSFPHPMRKATVNAPDCKVIKRTEPPERPS